MNGRCYCGNPPVVGLGYCEPNALFCVPCMHRHRTRHLRTLLLKRDRLKVLAWLTTVLS